MKSLKYFSLFTLLTLSLIFLPCPVQCQSGEFHIQKVTENLYMIGSTIGANVAFLITEEAVLCVDAKYFPYQGEQIIAKIRQVTDKPIKYLIYTHYHGDHTQGAQAFPSSTLIIAHKNTLKNMEEDGLARIEKDKTIYFTQQLKALDENVKKLQQENSPELKTAEEELQLKRFQIKDYERLKLRYPALTFEDIAVIHMGGKKIELLYLGKAHTDGDILVYFPQEKVIHMGDVLYWPGKEERMLNKENILKAVAQMEATEVESLIAEWESWVKILETAAQMDVEKVLHGHGDITDKTALTTQANHLKNLLTEIKKSY
jgi:glyoxylase-like metal-dependent hydrolase (beta-lactamase superfamily II)